MKYILAFVFLFIPCVLGHAADLPGYVNMTSGSVTTSPTGGTCPGGGPSCTLKLPVTAGNEVLLVGSLSAHGYTWTSIGDTFSCSWNHIVVGAYGTTAPQLDIWDCASMPSSGLTTISMTMNSGAPWCRVMAVQFHGTALDKVGAASSYTAATSYTTTASGTTSQANEFVLSFESSGSYAPVGVLPDRSFSTAQILNLGGSIREVSAVGSYTSSVTFPFTDSGVGVTITLTRPAMTVYRLGSCSGVTVCAGPMAAINGAVVIAALTFASAPGAVVLNDAASTGYTAQGTIFHDSGNHTWTQVFIGTITGASIANIAFSSGATPVSFAAVEYAGIAPTPAAFDKVATASNAATTSLVTGTTATTTYANEIWASVFAIDTAEAVLPGTAWTNTAYTATGTAPVSLQDQLVTAVGTCQGTGTVASSTDGGGLCLTFQSSSAAAAAVRHKALEN